MAMINLSNGSSGTRLLSSYNKEDIKKFLKNKHTADNQKKLREISREIYYTSPQYRRLVNYYATLFNLDYVLEGYGTSPDKVNAKLFKNAYFKNVDYVEKMNIKDQFTKARFISYRDGIFYGYARVSKDGFYIQELNPDYCQLSYVDIDTGLLGYSFDFSFFDSKENSIESFPNEFKSIYNSLNRDKSKSVKNKFVRIESPYAICLKPIPDFYAVPPFISLLEELLDIQDYKTLDKNSEEISNYMLLTQKIPMDQSGSDSNRFLLTQDWVLAFHQNIEDGLPSQVGLATTPMEIDVVRFDKEMAEKSKVSQATSQFWKDSGVSELLFGSDANSTASLKSSIIVDDSETFGFIKDIEKWINEHLKATQSGTYKFRVRILETTKHNRDAFVDSRLKAAQFGMPVKNEIIAAMGHQPSSMYLNNFLENEILELTEKLIPLMSSHTGNATNNEAGAPEQDERDLTDKGQQTRDLESNSSG